MNYTISPLIKTEIAKITITICCDLIFRADSRQMLILEHLYIIEVLTHANATIVFKDC